MNRFCVKHTHRGTSRAYRLLLARHSYDRGAQQQVVDEIGACANCWRDTALSLVDAAATLMIRAYPLPGMTPDGVVSGESVDLLLARIDGALEAEAADRRDLES